MPSGSDSTLAEANRLRVRASRLRSVAYELETSALTRLAQRAGDDTWAGPTARVFIDDLAVSLTRLRIATESLRSAAARLAHHADAVELAARTSLLNSTTPP